MTEISYSPFDLKIAEQHLKKLLKHYKIKVYQWSVGPNGKAYYDLKQIKIPHPTDIQRFCVAMHEIGHVVKGKSSKLYRSEYNAEMFALEQAALFNWDTSTYRERARWYVIMNIAKGYCRKLNLDSIEQDVKDFCQINFEEWKGKRVFVRRNTDTKKCTIEFTEL